MMRVAIIARSTLYTVPGGDTVQAVQTASHLADLGVCATIKLSNEVIDYSQYDLLHFFNIIRPADIVYHSQKAHKPYVVSTILVDYSEYDKHYRKGLGSLFSYLPPDSIEYLKTVARWLLGRDHLSSLSYIWKGQRKSIQQILRSAKMILPNSESEYLRVLKAYPSNVKYGIIPNGIDPRLFQYDGTVEKDPLLVLCVARIEGIKNQLNLIKALNNTQFKLLLIGNHSPNQQAYYQECHNIAAANIRFIAHLPQDELVAYYQKAGVHVLPSWFETTGLSSVEAAAMGCNLVITDKGDTREYFENDAFYCDPARPESILAAVEQASTAKINQQLRKKILKKYTWAQAAYCTLNAYQLVLPSA
ncbi:glycosyltransferase family 4 protein [Mucilaginibacter sp. UR6-11]|uniref:glycosyltransferase family 4 protein n=1 Tax=Mucilaginibacter sp. UR6-11 TaxID=1435644 RepID=UPI001E3A63CB|nr:glycosyltransferase family 4 protein [Mucilaginibacter sp. UR6-11]MCC8427145.1 glycosyltransferase family 4 protein [Mucilaginibacter sp. UR6-11]